MLQLDFYGWATVYDSGLTLYQHQVTSRIGAASVRSCAQPATRH